MRRMAPAAMVAVAIAAMACAGGADAHPHGTTYVALGGGIALERTTLELDVPADNALPWAFVEGRVQDPVDGYPVIIQVHARDGEPARFAQVDVGEDGSYEWRVRVLSVDDGVETRPLVGAYDVTVFKVVHAAGGAGAA